MLRDLGARCDLIVLTHVPQALMVAPEVMEEEAREACENVAVEPDLRRALEIVRKAVGEEGGVLVAGSLRLVGGVLAELGP